MKPQLLISALLFLCLSWASAQAQNDITVLTQLVLFDNKQGEEKPAQMRVNFDPRVADGTQFSVCLKPNDRTDPNGPSTACPVFRFPWPECFTVTKPAPHKFSLILKSNQTVTKQQMNCALTYSIVPLGQPPNYFGNPEIGVAYKLNKK
jgi:hypothetical protein